MKGKKWVPFTAIVTRVSVDKSLHEQYGSTVKFKGIYHKIP